MRLLSALALVLLCCAATPASCGAEERELRGDRVSTDNGALVVHPVSHATFLMQCSAKTIYVDPVGGAKPFADLPRPHLVLLSHAHFDHFDPTTLAAVVPATGHLVVVAPRSVAEKMPETLRSKIDVRILANGEKTGVDGIAIEAVPAYNTTPAREKFHPKGRDNGYVLTLGGKRVYIAGDTEDTPEMRALTSIDLAFLPMNLPYTMSIEKAAEAIRAFRPRIVYPYHYRNGDGTKADLEKLKRLVGNQGGVEIRTPDWYFPGQSTGKTDPMSPQKTRTFALVRAGLYVACLEYYSMDIGRFPTAAQGLDALFTAPADLADSSKWDGPYAREDWKRPLLDPWGNAWQYASSNPEQFELWSYGPDGINGTGDDVRKSAPRHPEDTRKPKKTPTR